MPAVEHNQAFKRVFAASPAPFLVLAPDAPRFTISDVNDAYLAATMRTRDDLVGRGIFEAFPDNPDDATIQGVSILRSSLERVLVTRQPNGLSDLKYDVARPDGSFEERWWSPINSPVLGERGEVEAIIHNAIDVTEQRRAQAVLRESEERYRQIVEGADDFAIIMLDARGVITSWNTGAERILGYSESEALGRHGDIFFTPEDREAGAPEHEMARAQSDGRALNERWHMRKDGSRFWGSGMMMRLDEDGGGYLKIFRDRTAEHEAEAALRAQALELQAVLDAVPVAIWIARDPAASRIDGNEVARTLLRAPAGANLTVTPEDPAEALSGFRVLDRDGVEIAPENLPVQRAARGEIVRDFEETILFDDGTAISLIGNANPLLTEDGRPRGSVASFIDITERKAAENALHMSEARFRAALEIETVGAIYFDMEGKLIDANEAFLRMGGYNREDLEAGRLTWQKLTPDEWLDDSHRAFAQLKATGSTTPYEKEYFRKDGTRWWALFAAKLLPDGTGFEFVLDISDRKRAELAAAATSAEFQALADNIPTLCWMAHADGFIYWYNRRWYEYTGESPETMKGWGWQAVHDPERLPKVAERWAHSIATGEPFEMTFPLRGVDGSFRPFLTRVVPIRNEAGQIERWFGTNVDITERIEAEALLEQRVAERTAERDRLWRNSQDLLVVVETDGTLAAVNKAWTAVLGWDEHELVGSTFMQLTHPDDLNAALVAFEKSFETPLIDPFEFRLRHKSGEYRWIAWTAAFEEGRVFANGRDVTTERKREAQLEAAKEQLRQSQKMEAMGSLTGGVAHDFNNLLTPIVGALDMLQRKGLGGEREQRLIDGAIQSADRAKTLVQRLLAFARRQPLQVKGVDLAPLVRGMADLVASTTGPQIKILVDADDGLPPALADPNQLEMAILNLAVNARDAMPDGGTLRISVDAETVGRQHRADLPPGRYLRLSVADTGAGMDEATLKRSVEPFFSTKGVGKGTGLGLSMVHGLASQLGGALTIHSTRGIGTNVELWLLQSAEPLVTTVPADMAPVAKGSGTALLVDDEDLVRLSTADMLIDLGYSVVEASSAEEALKLVDRGLRPDLLVTDHLMPGMSGTELARSLLSSRPSTKVLVVSGYAEADGVAPDLPRLTKPFRNADLAASLAALD